ncbi:MAG: DNA polymerase III subunit epsilon [bacterium]|nr:DNA polymerase III subunit epsilon [bacterium]
MREIVLDTETTGLDPRSGDRIVEIGCVELLNHMPTGETYHVYINPERDMPRGAFEVHGLSEEFLKEHPVFKDHTQGFLNFIQEDTLIIHNAAFDMKFLNAELQRVSLAPLSFGRVKDTLKMARMKYPGSPASLDALCRRFGVDNSNREKHGALLDSELLAGVYLELIGGRQPGLTLGVQNNSSENNSQKEGGENVQSIRKARSRRPAQALSPEEKEAHRVMAEKLKTPIWKQLSS